MNKNPHLIALGRLVLFQTGAVVVSLLTIRFVGTSIAPDTWGAYTLYLSVASAGATLFLNWPNGALVRYGREEYLHTGSLHSVLFARVVLLAAGLLLAGIFGILSGPAIRSFLKAPDLPVALIVATSAVLSISELCIQLSIATGRTSAHGYVPLIHKLTFLLLLATLPVLSSSRSMNGLAWCTIASAGISVIASGIHLRGIRLFPLHPDWSSLRRILAYSWSLPLGAIAALVVKWVDTWVLRIWTNLEIVGTYGLAYLAFGVVETVLLSGSVVLTPIVTDHAIRGNAQTLAGLIRRSMVISFLGGLAGTVALPLVLLSYRSIVGPYYRQSDKALIILLCSVPIQIFSYTTSPVVSSHKHLVGRSVTMSVIMATSNVVLDIALVPFLGMIGAAIATTLSWTIYGILRYHMFREFHQHHRSLALLLIGGFSMSFAAAGLTLCGLLIGSTVCLLVVFLAVSTVRFSKLISRADAAAIHDFIPSKFLRTTAAAAMEVFLPGA